MYFNREVKEYKKYDLIVCGGGVTGFAAAVSAARRGLKTAIIERFGCLGGVATTCGIHFLLGGRKYNPATGKMERKVGGIFDELTDRLIENGGALEPNDVDVNYNPFGWYPRMAAGIPIDPEKMKILMDEMCLAEGIDIYYFTSIVGTDVHEDRITNLILHNKSGLFALSSKVVVDSTGDADVAYMCGCPTVKGREEDGLMTPASLELVVEHVDRDELVQYQNKNQSPKFVEIIKKLKETGEWTFPFEIVVTMQLTEPDVFLVNTIRQVGIDGANGDSITKGMIEGRRDNMKLFEILKKHIPGFKNSRIRYISDVIGIRETRRIVGKYTVTVDEALSGKKFVDSIASTTYNWDLPDPLKPSFDPMMGHASNPNAQRKHDTIHIPYRSLLPQNISNLIVSGRCVSVERHVLGPVRIMGPCMGMGHAAGIASFLALQNDNNYSNIDVKILQENLIKEGSLLHV